MQQTTKIESFSYINTLVKNCAAKLIASFNI
nr:MAG TPA: hypothetical protein [Caudoviricetes sp.]